MSEIEGTPNKNKEKKEEEEVKKNFIKKKYDLECGTIECHFCVKWCFCQDYQMLKILTTSEKKEISAMWKKISVSKLKGLGGEKKRGSKRISSTEIQSLLMLLNAEFSLDAFSTHTKATYRGDEFELRYDIASSWFFTTNVFAFRSAPPPPPPPLTMPTSLHWELMFVLLENFIYLQHKIPQSTASAVYNATIISIKTTKIPKQYSIKRKAHQNALNLSLSLSLSHDKIRSYRYKNSSIDEVI